MIQTRVDASNSNNASNSVMLVGHTSNTSSAGLTSAPVSRLSSYFFKIHPLNNLMMYSQSKLVDISCLEFWEWCKFTVTVKASKC